MSEPELQKVYAPFSIGQAANLNYYQASGVMHPFTCHRRGDTPHRVTGDEGVLVATRAGWSCVDCDYTQSWAWDWMADGRWRIWQAESAELTARAQARESR